MTSLCIITVRLRLLVTSLIVDVTHHDTSTSTRTPSSWILAEKNKKVYDLEIFCEVVRFPGVNRDFLWGGYEVISGNKYFLRSCPNFFNDRPLMSSSTMMICFKIQ
jgi:hypothetical protein